VVGRSIPHEVVHRRPGDPPPLIANSGSIREALGWQPRYPDIDQIVETAWRWHSRYPKGYEDKRRAASVQSKG